VRAPTNIDRSRLPEPGSARSFTFPTIEKSTLASGLRVWTVPHPNVPVVNFALMFRRGAADDPAGQEGLAAISVDMLDEGSGGRSSIEMHEALAAIGAHLESDIGSDASLLGTSVLTRFAGDALALLADFAARPALTEPDFIRVRQLRLSRLRQLRDMPGAVADRAFARLLYGSHPYGHTPLGTEASLTSLSIDDVRLFHAGALRPSEATLVAVGDCDHQTIVRLAEDAFTGWDGTADRPLPMPTETPRVSRLAVVPRARAPQSELRVGHVAVDRGTPDFHALIAANMVLGGQFVSRLNLNLREDKGITYGARTAFDFRRLPGPFALNVSVQTEATAVAITESLGEIAAIRGPRAVTGEELALGVASLTRGYARGFETAEQVARAITQIALYDLPDNYFAEFVPSMERLTPEDVTRAAAAHLDPAALTTLVVGDFDAVREALAGLGMGDPVVLGAEIL
jgi:zinc protease